MRKNYIDNLRIFCILLLFPYHTFMIYNNFGESFYVYNKPVDIFSSFISINWTWFMPLMFTLAGISASFALKKRTVREFTKERVLKLLIPLVFGILLLVPMQTYFAEKYHNGYTDSYLKQYILFFAKETDFTGYTGGFTPGHLWFILYLFVISIISLPITIKFNKYCEKLDGKKFTLIKLISLFLISLIMTPILNIGGKSVGKYFALYLLGFFVLSNDDVINRLEKNKLCLTYLAVFFLIIKYILGENYSDDINIICSVSDELTMWVCILAFLGIGKQNLNYRNKFTIYFNKASFPIYIFHQSILVGVGYYALKFTNVILLQVVMIITFSFILTIICYEIAKRIPIVRFMFGINK